MTCQKTTPVSTSMASRGTSPEDDSTHRVVRPQSSRSTIGQ